MFYFNLLISDRQRKGKEGRKRDIHLLFHLPMHSLVYSCVFFDWESTPQPWSIETRLWPTELPSQSQEPKHCSHWLVPLELCVLPHSFLCPPSPSSFKSLLVQTLASPHKSFRSRSFTLGLVSLSLWLNGMRTGLSLLKICCLSLTSRQWKVAVSIPELHMRGQK